VSERVLTVRELNRALLARQLLLQRKRLSPARALEQIGPQHAQGVESTYVNLWSRIEGFRREQLTRALGRGLVVRSRPLRGTLHLTSARDYPLFHGAIRRGRAEWWQRTTKHRYDEKTTARAEQVLSRAGRAPRPFAELVEAIGGDRFLANLAAIRLGVLTVAPAGTWGYHGVEDYVVGPPPADRDEGMRRLVRCYFAAFGPATIDDLCFWASLGKSEARPFVEELELTRFRDEKGRLLLDLPRAPLPPADTPAPPRFLLRWDNLYLGHASGERDRIVPASFRRRVYTVNTVMPATFLVDGFVAGTWRHERGRVRIEPWRRLTRAERAEVEGESKRLADFLSG
jgi:hypothetical protein